MNAAAQAYADYNDLMDMTEQMISEMVLEINDRVNGNPGSYKIQYHANGPENDPIEIDFTPPWRRVSMMEELEKLLDVKMPTNLETEEARAFLDKLCKDKKVDCANPRVRILQWCNQWSNFHERKTNRTTSN